MILLFWHGNCLLKHVARFMLINLSLLTQSCNLKKGKKMKVFSPKALSAVASLIGGLGLVAAGSASAIVIGGVDFGALGLTSHLETTTVAETLITGNGQNLLGYGQVNTVNGAAGYAGAQSLYFVLNNYTSNGFSATNVGFTGGTIDVFLGATFNLLNQSSLTDITTIQGYTPWASFTGHTQNNTGNTLAATGFLTGSSISFTGAGLLDVSGGLADVVAFLNSNAIGDSNGPPQGFADVAFTTSGNNIILNQNDNIAGCQNGTASAGQFCLAGSADFRGPTVQQVPEPASLALVGIALFGMGGVSLRKRK